MSNENEDFENEELEQEISEQQDTSLIKDLRKKANDGQKAKREAEIATNEANAAKRELALLKSGVDVNSPTGKLFAKSYEGELTPEAIKAEAEQYGLIPTSQTSEVKEELNAFDRVSNASSGSQGYVAPTAMDELMKAGNAADGGSPEAILAVLSKYGVPISNEQPQPGFIRI